MVLNLEDSFGFLLNRLARAVEISFDGALARHGLTASGWGVLKTLERAGPSSLKDITAALGIDASNTGRQVDRMQAAGLVVVKKDINDGRARRVELAEPGRALIPDLERLARDYNARWLAVLPDENRAILLESLTTMLESSGTWHSGKATSS